MKLSVRRRFAFTVGANLFRSLLSFSTGLLIARWLGPGAYGDMAFLLGTFVGLRQLLDMGSSTAFFTFLSQRSRSKQFVLSYYGWLAIQFLLPVCIIALFFPGRWIDAIWHGEPRALVLLAFAAAFMQNSVWPVVQQVGESQRQTVWVQGVGVVVVAIHLVAVALLWWARALGLSALFALIAVEYLVAGVVAQRRIAYAPEAEAEADSGQVRSRSLRRYLDYCVPMIPYSAMAFAQEFGDRWLLQNYGGGVQQAFYAVGAQFAAIALLATTSILRIFWKEVAEAHHQEDYERASRLYQRVSRLLFLVGAVVAGFLIPWSADLLRRLLGPAYIGGATTLAIMFLYPVHQSMGQIGSTVLYATERVRLQVVTGILTMALGLLVSYFVLAPPTATVPGLGLGSQGLAVKMVGVQLVSVNVIAYLISRVWGTRFDWLYQPVTLFGCAAMGWTAHACATVVLSDGTELVLKMTVAGILYLGLLAIFVSAIPWVAGLTREELRRDLRRVFDACRSVYARRPASVPGDR